LLAAVAILHLSITFSVFIIGKYQLVPSQFYPSGIGGFASDGLLYERQIPELSELLRTQGVRAWATSPMQLHVRLYSLPFAVFSRWASFNVLTIEPVNLFYYLAILIFTFKIGARVFDYHTGLIAATIVALWPSLLLHTTQVLRDPLLILAFLVAIWCLIKLIERDFGWRGLPLIALAGVASLLTIRIVRLPMWYVMLLGIAGAVLFFVLRSIQQRQFRMAAAVFALLMIAAVGLIPPFQPYFHNQQVLGIPRVIDPEEEDKRPLVEQMYRRREAFEYQRDLQGVQSVAEDGSRIDSDMRLNTAGGVIRHLPRAFEIGFFAPFPNMWLGRGKQVGASGRLFSGFETLLTYVIESMALIGLWWQRRNLAAWLLLIVAAAGAISLGLVVNNIGAMYRLRYPFWVLLVVLGAAGARFLFRRFTAVSVDYGASREVPL